MTTQSPQNLSFKSSGDNSANQYKFMKLTADKTVGLCAAITDVAVGVQQNNECKAAGDPVTVAVAGTTKVIAAAAIALGAKVAPTAAGLAQLAVSTQNPRGIALQAAAALNDIIEIQLIGATAPLP